MEIYTNFQKYNFIIKSSMRLCLPVEIVAALMVISQTKVPIILGQGRQLKNSSLSHCYLHLHLGLPGKKSYSPLLHVCNKGETSNIVNSTLLHLLAASFFPLYSCQGIWRLYFLCAKRLLLITFSMK